MKRVVQPLDKCCRGLACGGAFLARVVFVLLLLAQGAFLVHLLGQGPLPVPAMIRDRIDAALAERGLRIETAQLIYDFTGGLYARDAAVYRLEGQDPLVEAQGLFAQVDLLQLLVGKVAITAVRLDEGRVLLPAVLSPSGVARPAVSGGYAQLRARGDYWEVELLRFEHEHVRVFAKGTLRLDGWPDPTPESEAEPLLGQVTALWRRLESMQALLDRLERPTVNVDLSMGTATRVDGAFTLRATRYRDPAGWSIEDLVAAGRGVNLTDRRLPRPLVLRAREVRFPWLVLEGVESRLRIEGTAPGLNLAEAEISAGTLIAQELAVNGVATHVEAEDGTRFRLQGGVSLGQGMALVEAAFDSEAETAAMVLRTRLDVAPLRRLPAASDFLSRLPLDLGAPPYVRLEGTWTEGYQFDGGGLYATIADTRAKDVFIEHGVTWGSFDRDELRLEHFVGLGRNMDVTGTLVQSLRDLRHEVTVKGQIRPSYINPWLKDWWDNIWEDLLFHGDLPTIDLRMKGLWQLEQARLVFGRADGEDASYRGLVLDRCGFDFAAWPGYATLHNLQGSHLGEPATGQLQWVNIAYEPREVAFYIDFATGISPRETLRTLGAPWDELRKEFTFAGATQSDLHARLVYHPGEDFHAKDATAHLATTAPLTIWGVPFDSLALTALRHLNATEDALLLEEINGEGMGGEIEAEAMIDLRNADDPRLSASVDLRGTSLVQVQEVLASFQEDEESDPENEEEAGAIPREALLDLDLNVAGRLNDPWQMSGEGSFTLTEGNLAELHLFGVLSRALEVIPFLTFSTLYIERGEGRFTLDEGVLAFPDLVFSGDGTEINADGTVQLPSTALDFNVELHLLKQSESPLILLSPFLYPFAKVFEVKLRGTLEEPDWRLRMFAGGEETRTVSP